MNESLQGACWKAEDAKEILATEALEGKASVFLATHFPIEDYEIDGSQGSDIESPTEGALGVWRDRRRQGCRRRAYMDVFTACPASSYPCPGG